MTDLTEMEPREVIRLMRGSRAELKLGYSPHNAVSAALTLTKGTAIESELTSYAEGFSDGMQRSETMASQNDTPSRSTDAYCVGYTHGTLEPTELTYPSQAAI